MSAFDKNSKTSFLRNEFYDDVIQRNNNKTFIIKSRNENKR